MKKRTESIYKLYKLSKGLKYKDLPKNILEDINFKKKQNKDFEFEKDKTIYHGSNKKIKKLRPMPHYLFEDEKVVFGTPSRGMAISFLADWTDEDFDQGTINMGPLYMKELYEGAFEKIFKEKSGFLYHLDGKPFEYYPQLMTKERASKVSPKILKVEEIDDVLEALKDSDIKMIYYKDLGKKKRSKKSKASLLPFEEKLTNNKSLLRKFGYNVNSEDLIWHRDREDRVIKVIKSNNWKFQFDNKLPQEMKDGDVIIIKKNAWHRVIKGQGDLLIEIIKK